MLNGGDGCGNGLNDVVPHAAVTVDEAVDDCDFPIFAFLGDQARKISSSRKAVFSVSARPSVRVLLAKNPAPSSFKFISHGSPPDAFDCCVTGPECLRGILLDIDGLFSVESEHLKKLPSSDSLGVLCLLQQVSFTFTTPLLLDYADSHHVPRDRGLLSPEQITFLCH